MTPGTDSSPVQRLMSWCTLSFIPCSTISYQPKVQIAVTEQLVNKRRIAKKHYDLNAKPLPDLFVGQPIRAKTNPKVDHSPWFSVIVKARVAPRSSTVEVNGRQYRRNRVHLRDSGESTITSPSLKPDVTDTPSSDIAADVEEAPQQPAAIPQPSAEMLPTQPQRTSSGREVKRPQRLCDYVTK